jgi:ketosteroid isomerase-like protein
MSEGNLGIVLGALDAYRRGDEEAMYAAASPEIVVTQFPDQLDADEFHGLDGLRQMMTGWLGTWDDWTIEITSFAAEDKLVFLNGIQRGRGKGSGVPIESEVTFLFTVEDGLIARWQIFHSEQEAREAATAGG